MIIVLKDFMFRMEDFISCGIRYENPVIGQKDGSQVRAHEKPMLYLVLRTAVPGTASIVTMLRGDDDLDTMNLYGRLMKVMDMTNEDVEATMQELQGLLHPLTEPPK